MMLRVRVLGGLAISHEGRAIELPGSRERALLVFLAVTGTAQARERLAGLLWPDRAEEQARQSLRQSLSALRRAGIPLTGENRQDVALAPAVAVDARSFLTLAASNSLEALRESVALYAGEFLEGWTGGPGPFEDWLVAERARLSQCLIDAAARLLDWQLPPLDAPERLFLARKARACDPYHEAIHVQELRALTELGLRGEAIIAAQDFTRKLKDDLGLAPDAGTQRVHADLRAGGTAAAAPAIATGRSRLPRVAVFPFSGDSQTVAHLCAGLMSEIAVTLSRFHSLQVIATGSSFQLAQHPARAAAARSGLRADYVLEGALTASADEVRISLQLVDLADNAITWSETFTGSGIDYARLLNDIGHRVADRVDHQIDHHRRASAQTLPADKLAAYDWWLRGQHLSMQWTADVEAEAEAMFRKALDLDPRLARAHSSLALLVNGTILVSPGHPAEREQRNLALAHARLAIDCDPQDPRSHLAMAWVSLFLCDRHTGARHAQLALELNPHGADVLIHVGLVKAHLGDAALGLRLAAEAIDLNPFFPDWYNYMKSQIHVLAGEHERALEIGLPSARQFLELPGWMAISAFLSGRPHVAAEMAQLLREGTRGSWIGVEPWTEAAATEWFLSINRWLQGREREIVVAGLTGAGLL